MVTEGSTGRWEWVTDVLLEMGVGEAFLRRGMEVRWKRRVTKAESRRVGEPFVGRGSHLGRDLSG